MTIFHVIRYPSIIPNITYPEWEQYPKLVRVRFYDAQEKAYKLHTECDEIYYNTLNAILTKILMEYDDEHI